MSVLLAAAITFPSPGVLLEPPDFDAAVKELTRVALDLDVPEQEARDDPPAPAPVHRVVGYDTEQWRGLIAKHFADVDRALCVVEWESGGNPNARSATDDHGLFQIHYPIWGPAYKVTRRDLYDPLTNVLLASDILNRQGWGAWSAVNRGKC